MHVSVRSSPNAIWFTYILSNRLPNIMDLNRTDVEGDGEMGETMRKAGLLATGLFQTEAFRKFLKQPEEKPP